MDVIQAQRDLADLYDDARNQAALARGAGEGEAEAAYLDLADAADDLREMVGTVLTSHSQRRG